jgi:hypothetical protein
LAHFSISVLNKDFLILKTKAICDEKKFLPETENQIGVASIDMNLSTLSIIQFSSKNEEQINEIELKRAREVQAIFFVKFFLN